MKNKAVVVILTLFLFTLIGCSFEKEPEITLESIEIKEEGKKEYKVGEEFDLSDFTLLIKYSNKDTKEVSISKDMIDNSSFTEAGTFNITVSYTEKEITKNTIITVKVIEEIKEKQLTSIQIKEKGKTEYQLNDMFDISGYSLELKYDDSSSDVIPLTMDYIDAPDMFMESGIVTINVVYKESFKCSFEINVLKPIIKLIGVSLKNTGKLTYTVGESFDVTNYIIELKYSDDTTKLVDVTNEMLIGDIHLDQVGEKSLTISYTEEETFTCIVNILVLEPIIVPVSIEMTSLGETIICSGKELDLSGFKAVIKYSDGTSKEKDITSDMVDKVSFPDNETDESMEYEILVSYDENDTKVTTTFKVEVYSEWNFDEYFGPIRDREMIQTIYEHAKDIVPFETQTDIELISSADYGYEYVIIWLSSNDVALSSSGKVELGEEDVDVVLTLQIRGYYVSEKFEFNVKVKGLGPIIMPTWNKNEKHIFAYFYEGTSHYLEEKDASKIDVVNYCFARVSGTSIDVSGLSYLKENLKLRRSHKLRFVLSIGGGGTGSTGFSAACETLEKRTLFIESMIDVMKKYGFDGIDLDWEYPAWTGLTDSHPYDRANFTLLCKELRAALDEYKEGMLLTAAVIGGTNVGRFYEVSEINKYLDYAHIMTYDLNNEGIASHHCNTYDGRTYSAEGAMKTYKNEGMDYEKMVIGAAFYGKISELITPTTATSAVLNKPTANTTTISYTKIASDFLTDSSFKKLYDDINGAYYLTDGKFFITYDDPDAIRLKCQLVKEYNLQGIMFWDYGSDNTGRLLSSVASGIDAINLGRL